jgi:hypothetical protein
VGVEAKRASTTRRMDLGGRKGRPKLPQPEAQPKPEGEEVEEAGEGVPALAEAKSGTSGRVEERWMWQRYPYGGEVGEWSVSRREGGVGGDWGGEQLDERWRMTRRRI